MLRVYLDNVAVCARVLGDLRAAEQAALNLIEAAHNAGKLKRVTSRESWREQERTHDPVKRAAFKAARAEVSVVTHDHTVLVFGPLTNRRGVSTIVPSGPTITDIVDEALFTDLKRIGLKQADARHLMYAVGNDCQRFITTDPDFHDRLAALEARCPSTRVMNPTELVAELGLS